MADRIRPPHKSSTAAELRRLVKASGLTYQELEARSGVPAQTIWELVENERGDGVVARYEAVAEAIERHLVLAKGKG